MKKLVRDINITINNDNTKVFKVDVEVHSRNGSKSQTTWVFIYNGKRYAPYAQNKFKMSPTMNCLFKLIYGDNISDLIYRPSILTDILK